MNTKDYLTVKDFAIGVLSVTAVILLTALLITQAFLPKQAMAFAQNGSAGHYLATTSQLDDTSELLTIFNTRTQQLNVYGFNVENWRLVLIQPPFDMERLSRAARQSIRPEDRSSRGAKAEETPPGQRRR